MLNERSCSCGQMFYVDEKPAAGRSQCPKCAASLGETGAVYGFIEDNEPEKSASDSKRKKRRVPDDGGLAAQYMAEGRRKAERAERRVRVNHSGGMTFFGITLTAGFIGGVASMFFAVLGALAAYSMPEARRPQIWIVSGVFFVLGGFAVIHALFGGEED